MISVSGIIDVCSGGMMEIKLQHNRCNGCESCANICSKAAITMKEDEEGFFYPQIDQERCVNCGKCISVCPVLKSSSDHKKVKKVFAAYNKNDEIRKNSTSGGIFTALAEYVLDKKGGAVVGVAFSEDCLQTEFRVMETGEELSRLQKSKYLQARVGKAYQDVKELLTQGRVVLFTGLPCHVEALLSFLGQRYDNLICMDMICFGVPSPGMWRKYALESFEKKNIKGVIFKDKTPGWKNWCFKVIFDNGEEIRQERYDNPYLYSYLEQINIRPSCYSCTFKGLGRVSDFTIADCWGKGEENRNLNDNQGLSAVVIQSEKALQIWNVIKENLKYEEYEPMELMEGNWAMFHCVKENTYRKEFFETASRKSFLDAVTGYQDVKRREEKIVK